MSGPLYAVVRLNTVDPRALAAAQDRLGEFDRTHAAQPGHLGSLVVDLGSDRQLVVNLWASRHDADAALATLGPQVDRLLAPLMTGPSVLIGAGPVLSLDLRRYPQAGPPPPREGRTNVRASPAGQPGTAQPGAP